MAIIPETLKGLEFLKESLTNQIASSTHSYENVFDTIEEQIELSRDKNEEYTIVMPQFKITSDIQAEDYLRKVRGCHFLEDIKLSSLLLNRYLKFCLIIFIAKFRWVL